MKQTRARSEISRSLFAALVACTFATSTTVHAATEAEAGSSIANTASMSFAMSGATTTVASNTVLLMVDELIDVGVAPDAPTIMVGPDQECFGVPFTVFNHGNGAESFDITATTDEAVATAKAIAADRDRNGIYDPAVDIDLQGSTIAISGRSSVRIFAIVCGAHAAAHDFVVKVHVVGASRHGDAGTTFPGQGENGADAVIGHSGGSAEGSTTIHRGAAVPRLEKAQAVTAPDGSSRVMPGSIITYSLSAIFPGAINMAEIRDLVPEGTTYVAGSLTLDGLPLSDAADADNADFDGSAIRVALGNVAAATTHTITFQTKID